MQPAEHAKRTEVGLGSRNAATAALLRCHIVLAAAAGEENVAIAQEQGAAGLGRRQVR